MRQNGGSPETANIKKKRIVNSKQRQMKKPKIYEYIRGPSEDWNSKQIKEEIVEERTELLLQMKEGLRESETLAKEIEAMWSLFSFEKNVLNLEMATVLRQSSGHLKETETQVLFAALGECLDNLKTETDLLKFPANKMVAEILKTVWYPIENEEFENSVDSTSNQGVHKSGWTIDRFGSKQQIFGCQISRQNKEIFQNSQASKGLYGEERDIIYQQNHGNLKMSRNNNKNLNQGIKSIYNPKRDMLNSDSQDKANWKCFGPRKSDLKINKKSLRNDYYRRDSYHPLEIAGDHYYPENSIQDSVNQSDNINLNIRKQRRLKEMPFASVAFKAVDVFLKAAELKEILSQKLMIEKICENKKLCADKLDWELKQKSLLKKLNKQSQKNKDLEAASKTKDQQIEFFKGILSKVLDKNGVVANGVNTLFKMFQSTNDFRRTLQNFNSQGISLI